ncbi:glycosyltransferase family 2 protein [Kocuria rosea]|uniref:glycosyltransferase family 2 protein n=1 Tax=Kocuria rosea TaxID=1275 RepID=UPI002040CD9F|nr:glycosyltransferase family 2 protein [Kocuria rosea]
MEWVDALRMVVSALLGLVAVPVLIYFLLINTSYLLLIILASADAISHRRRAPFAGLHELTGSRTVPGISVITPMYNEQMGIRTAVESFLSLHHPRHEVIVVDDGSHDEGFEVLRNHFDLVPVSRQMPTDVSVREHPTSVHVPRDGRTRLTVVRKANSGRSDSINVGVNLAREELVLFVDADSVLDPDALLTVCRPFVDDPVRTVAAGGVIRAVNDCRVRDGRVVDIRMPRSPLADIQVIEYLRAFHLGRAGWSKANALILISGAFGVFRRDVLVEVGGLDAASIGEDFELVLRLHRHLLRKRQPYRLSFVTEPICWTEVPSTVSVLRRQRIRWHRGLWETLWAYRGMVFNPRYGRVGMVSIPYYWAFELFAPLVELAGLALIFLGLILGVVSIEYFALFLLVAYAYAIFVTIAAVTVEELSYHKYRHWRDLGILLAAAVFENIGYRQATAVWRMEGWFASLTGRRQVWGTMTRSGFNEADA